MTAQDKHAANRSGKPRVRINRITSGRSVTVVREDFWLLIFHWRDFASEAEAWHEAMRWYHGGASPYPLVYGARLRTAVGG